MALWLLLGLGITGLDQLTKAVVIGNMQLGQSVVIIPHVFSLTYVNNTGAAFGLLSNQTALLSLVSATVLVSAFIWRRRMAEAPLPMKLALSLALGGALGNLIDRVCRGYVVDFLHLERWPIFNVADMAIDIGVGLLLLMALRQEKDAKPQEGEAE